MKNKLFFLLVILSLSLTCKAYADGEKPEPKITQEQNKISLDLKGVDIIEALKIMSNRSGMNIIIGKNVSGRVTLFLKNVDIWDAFEIMLLSNDLAYERKGSIINIMTQRDYELQYGERYKDKKQAKIIQLKYAKAADLSKALSQIKTNLGKIVVEEGSNTLALLDTQEKIKEMEEFIKNTDLPIKTKVFNLNYALSDKVQPKIQETVTKGIGSVKIDERTNKIIVSDYPEKIDEIEKMISAFDEKTPQVLIDAQIVEISPNKDEFSMGVDWDYWLKKNVRLINSLPAPILSSATTIPIKLAFGVASGNQSSAPSNPGNYKSIIDMLRVIGETKILSSPRIMALNNQESKILVGTKDAYITSTVSQSGAGTSVTAQSVNFVDVGIKLFVTPTINREGFVTMKIRPEISSSKRTDIVSQGQITQIPIVTTSETETTIMVKDGTTIIIAGMKKDQRDKEIKKIPVLGDIPLLGHFFKNTKDSITKTELVIFITPHIVTGDEPLEYVSITGDKDITQIQTLAKTEARYASSGEQDFPAFGEYKEKVLNKIKSGIINLKGNDKTMKGKLTLSFILNRNGQLNEEPRVLSSTNTGLNQVAIANIEKLTPFPYFPESIGKEPRAFNVTLSYE